ncbi:MAG: 16S rRNA (guanine(966)-N(2))-methyltransferase RsmD [Pseudomonadota bacterium]
MKAAPKSVIRRPAASKPPGEVRIIGGLWKRTKLPVAVLPGLRPTPDRVRETLFNWLGQDLSGWRCIDVFAGTGALGFEAASRGAASVLLCEQAVALLEPLKALATKLQATAVTVARGDGLAQLRRQAPASLDLVFIDPPFESELYLPALQAASEALASNGFIYLEAPRSWTDEELVPLRLQLHRTGKAGMVHFHLLKKAAEA